MELITIEKWRVDNKNNLIEVIKKENKELWNENYELREILNNIAQYVRD